MEKIGTSKKYEESSLIENQLQPRVSERVRIISPPEFRRRSFRRQIFTRRRSFRRWSFRRQVILPPTSRRRSFRRRLRGFKCEQKGHNNRIHIDILKTVNLKLPKQNKKLKYKLTPETNSDYYTNYLN